MAKTCLFDLLLGWTIGYHGCIEFIKCISFDYSDATFRVCLMKLTVIVRFTATTVILSYINPMRPSQLLQ